MLHWKLDSAAFAHNFLVMEFHLKIEKHYKADKDINVEMSCKYAPVRLASF